MEQRLSFITLGVSDLAKSRAFYEALGWTASKYGDGHGIVFFQVGGMVMALFPHDELAKDADLPAEPSRGFRGVSISHNTRTEAEVDTVLAQAVAAGAKVLKAPHKASWGGYMGYFADPDGHAFEVCYNPHAELSADGAIKIPS